MCGNESQGQACFPWELMDKDESSVQAGNQYAKKHLEGSDNLVCGTYSHPWKALAFAPI